MSRSGASTPSLLGNERMATALLDAAPTALYVFDLAGRSPIFVSPRGPEILGLDPATVEAMGADFLLRTMHPDDRDRVTVHFEEFANSADGQTRVFEYRMRAMDGTWRWFRSHDVVFGRDPEGKPSQILGLALDVTEHKAAESALQESEASFRRLADALPQFVWVTEADGVLSYVNERWTAFSGLDLAQTKDPAAMAALYHPEDRDRVAAAWTESFAGGVPLEIEARMRGQAGVFRWFLIRGVPVSNGKGARWFGTSTDVTERKAAEAALRVSEERYRDLLGRIDQGFCVFEMLYGPDGRAHDYRFLEVNPTFARHTGLVDPAGKTARELVPELEDYWVQRYAQVAETGIPQRFEQGSEAMGRWFEVEAVRVGAEGSRRVALLFADVTERKRAATLLARRQQEFEMLAEHLPDVVVRFDRKLRHTYVNAAATAASGLSREAYLGRTNAELGLPPELVQLWTEHSRAAFATGEEQYLAFTYDGPVGIRHYEARVVPERGADGKIETLLTVTTDITNRRRIEQERTTFLDAIAHDLKNPLSVAKAQAQLAQRRLQRGVVDSARLEASLEGIETAVDGAVALIDELLDVAHLQAGRSLDLHRAPADLVVLAQDAVATARQSTTSHHMSVAASVPGLVGAWDAARLRRVLANLLDNAVKYSPDGGEVAVRVAQEEDATGVWAVLSVHDRGIGIPAADLPHLFERFRRGGNVASIGGTGIGLAGAWQIVAQHGGSIAVASKEGAGSTFTIRLPLEAVGNGMSEGREA